MDAAKKFIVLGIFIVAAYFVLRPDKSDDRFSSTVTGPTFAGEPMSEKDAADLGVPADVQNVGTLTQHDTDGKRQYALSDLLIDSRLKPWQDVILAGINKVARENTNCIELDPSSAYISPSKGTKKDPVFFVACEGADGLPFNVFFSASDVKAAK